MHKETIQDIVTFFKNADIRASNRLDLFSTNFDMNYPNHDEKRVAAETLIWSLMGPSLMMYAVNLNGAAIIELHALLEFISKRHIINHLSIKPEFKNLNRLFNYHTLDDYAKILKDMSILDSSDIKFIDKLTKLRNGVAHKNTAKLKDYINSGIPMSYIDIYYRMAHYDILPEIFKTLEIIIKIFNHSKSITEIGDENTKVK